MTNWTGNPWIDWPIAAATLLVAYLTIWQKGVKPFFRFIHKFMKAVMDISEATPILIDIAHEFKPNHGSSLRDVVDGVHEKIDGLSGEIGKLRDHQRLLGAEIEAIGIDYLDQLVRDVKET